MAKTHFTRVKVVHKRRLTKLVSEKTYDSKSGFQSGYAGYSTPLLSRTIKKIQKSQHGYKEYIYDDYADYAAYVIDGGVRDNEFGVSCNEFGCPGQTGRAKWKDDDGHDHVAGTHIAGTIVAKTNILALKVFILGDEKGVVTVVASACYRCVATGVASGNDAIDAANQSVGAASTPIWAVAIDSNWGKTDFDILAPGVGITSAG
ncbi:hypothetical protein CEK25_012186 [Fusarium fujikuroi]|nr:hypothetical protein CEK25_012186 [Fusarium fujikuroi]